MKSREPAPLAVQRRANCGLRSGAPYRLTPPRRTKRVDFFAVADSRRSECPTRPLDDKDLSRLLWFGARCQETFQDANLLLRQHRRYPSAGGIYETTILVVDSASKSVAEYNAITHALQSIEPERKTFSRFMRSLHRIVAEPVTIIGLAAHTCPLALCYANPDSLLWRDAGCALSMLHMTASALGMKSTILGILGDDLARSLSSPCGNYIATGLLAVGAP